MPVLVTKESLQRLLADPERREHVIGRALMVIHSNQTASEKATLDTNTENGIGFTGPDAKSGSLTARFYSKNGFLLDWMVEKWNGPRLLKYHRQLNDAAVRKNEEKQRSLPSLK